MTKNFNWKQMIYQVVAVGITAGAAFFAKEYVQTVDWKQAWEVAKGWLAWGAVGGLGLNQVLNNIKKDEQ